VLREEKSDALLRNRLPMSGKSDRTFFHCLEESWGSGFRRRQGDGETGGLFPNIGNVII
jgi:hypothetical protein